MLSWWKLIMDIDIVHNSPSMGFKALKLLPYYPCSSCVVIIPETLPALYGSLGCIWPRLYFMRPCDNQTRHLLNPYMYLLPRGWEKVILTQCLAQEHTHHVLSVTKWENKFLPRFGLAKTWTIGILLDSCSNLTGTIVLTGLIKLPHNICPNYNNNCVRLFIGWRLFLPTYTYQWNNCHFNFVDLIRYEQTDQNSTYVFWIHVKNIFFLTIRCCLGRLILRRCSNARYPIPSFG